MGSGFAKRKKEAKMMQEQFGKMQSQMQSMEVVGSAANGLVTITLSGEGDLKQIKIKKSSLSGQMNLDETLTEKTQSEFKKKKAELSACQQGISRLESEITVLNAKLLVWSEKILGNDNQKHHFSDELKHNEDSLIISAIKIDGKVNNLLHLEGRSRHIITFSGNTIGAIKNAMVGQQNFQ